MSNPENKGGRRAFMMRMRSKYRLVISNAETFQEVWGMRLSRLNFLVALGTFILIVLAFAWAIIFFTPVREFIPGYANSAITQQVVANALRADSLEREIDLWGKYLENLRIMLSGGTPTNYLKGQDSVTIARPVEMIRSGEDSALRAQMEQDWGHVAQPSSSGTTPGELRGQLVAPVEGVVSSSYSVAAKHFGTDIVGNPDAPIRAVADGVVLMTTWEVQQGHVIAVQHYSGLVSIYKHNQRLLKQMGDHVRAGDAIAIMGSTGRLSTGPHLHLELWLQGRSLNAEDYIAFK